VSEKADACLGWSPTLAGREERERDTPHLKEVNNLPLHSIIYTPCLESDCIKL
jgi:hypothetical protein